MYYDQQNPNKRSLHTYDIEGINAIYDKVTIKNEFRNPNGTISNGGIINVGYTDYNTNGLPNNVKSFAFNKNSIRRFEAKDQSFQNLDRRFNPFELYGGGWRFGINTLIGTEAVINPNVATGTYRARYRYKTNIGLNAITEFNGTIATGLTIGQIYQYDNGNITAPPSYQPSGSNINYNFAGWEDNLALSNTRNIAPTDNQTYNVLYKYPHHSNQSNAYSNPGQRRFVKTPDGVKHIVYESMNKVWYEISTDGGNTWKIMNNGKPLTQNASKNPSMDFYGNVVAIIFQEQNGYSYYLKLATFCTYGSYYILVSRHL